MLTIWLLPLVYFRRSGLHQFFRILVIMRVDAE